MTMNSWPDLWYNFYHSSVGILWAILLEYPLDSRVCALVAGLLLSWRYKYEISITP